MTEEEYHHIAMLIRTNQATEDQIAAFIEQAYEYLSQSQREKPRLLRSIHENTFNKLKP